MKVATTSLPLLFSIDSGHASWDYFVGFYVMPGDGGYSLWVTVLVRPSLETYRYPRADDTHGMARSVRHARRASLGKMISDTLYRLAKVEQEGRTDLIT
jgi:hypothetical protein